MSKSVEYLEKNVSDTVKPMPYKKRVSDFEDEINLVELIAVLWRRRWFMACVVAAVVVLAVIYAMSTTPQYRISAQLSPGITGYNDINKPLRDWSTDDIDSWFKGGSYLEALLAKDVDPDRLPEIRSNSARKSSFVSIDFLWGYPEEGKKIMATAIDALKNSKNTDIVLNRAIMGEKILENQKKKDQIEIQRSRLKDDIVKEQENYNVDMLGMEKKILDIKKSLEMVPITEKRLNITIKKINNDLKLLDAEKKSIVQNKSQTLEVLTQLKKQIITVDNETQELMKLRQNMINGKSDQVALLMYSNVVQQNIAYLTSLQQRAADFDKEINQYDVQIAAKLKEFENYQLQIQDIDIERDTVLVANKIKLQKELSVALAGLAKLKSEAKIKLQDLKVKREEELQIEESILNKQLETFTVNMDAITPIEVVQAPISSLNPVKPQKTKIVAMAFVLGCFLAFLLAFLVEFYVKNKEQLTQS